MKKYHFDVKINGKRGNNAGSKATQDCKEILLNNGYEDLEILLIKVWYLLPLYLVKLLATLIYYIIIIQPNSFIVVQYPVLGINRFFKYFIKPLKLKGCRFCCLIHDLDSLRSVYDKSSIQKEIDALSAYDAVISHNKSMTSWLQENGYKGHIEEIFLFDYLVLSDKQKENKIKSEYDEIAFAGALNRGSFLKKLAENDNTFYLNLYGTGFKKNIIGNNTKIKWCGSFSPEQIINEVNGDFGLIWDGDSTQEITGLAGHYIRYNTPHKTSLYLASGLPVIISKNAAIASFVQDNNIGVCINSLSEISTEALDISSELYRRMKENVLLVGQKLRKGYYLENAINRTLDFLENNK